MKPEPLTSIKRRVGANCYDRNDIKLAVEWLKEQDLSWSGLPIQCPRCKLDNRIFRTHRSKLPEVCLRCIINEAFEDVMNEN